MTQSRNQREGGYLGQYRDITSDERNVVLRRHRRKGKSSRRTLREGVQHFYVDRRNDYLSPEMIAAFNNLPMFRDEAVALPMQMGGPVSPDWYTAEGGERNKGK